MNFQKYYDLESYLLDTVRANFLEDGSLSAFDFFCIIIWKANRSKSNIAKKLKKVAHSDLEMAVKRLTSSLHSQGSLKERLKILMKEWKFGLPMASAILTILYPEEFTVYDVRVCESLNDFANLKNLTKFDNIWEHYSKFMQRVSEAGSKDMSLRERDRWLWGKSFHDQLLRDLKSEFRRMR